MGLWRENSQTSNIDIDKDILENVDIDIDKKDILENIDIDEYILGKIIYFSAEFRVLMLFYKI